MTARASWHPGPAGHSLGHSGPVPASPDASPDLVCNAEKGGGDFEWSTFPTPGFVPGWWRQPHQNFREASQTRSSEFTGTGHVGEGSGAKHPKDVAHAFLSTPVSKKEKTLQRAAESRKDAFPRDCWQRGLNLMSGRLLMVALCLRGRQPGTQCLHSSRSPTAGSTRKPE